MDEAFYSSRTANVNDVPTMSRGSLEIRTGFDDGDESSAFGIYTWLPLEQAPKMNTTHARDRAYVVVYISEVVQ
jgi:DUF971 family protein